MIGDGAWKWLFFLSGVCGSFLLLESADGLLWDHRAVYLAELFILLSLGLCYWFRKSRKRYYPAAGFIFACIVWFAMFKNDCLSQIPDLFYFIIQNGSEEQKDITAAVILMMAAASICIYVSEVLMKMHWPVYLCITGVMLASAFVGIQWKKSTMFLIVMFQFSFWMIHNLERAGGILPVRVMGRFSMVFLTAFFLAALLLVGWKTDWFYQTAYRVEGAVKRAIERTSENPENFSDGVINRGNIYPAGILKMELDSGTRPAEKIYLKDFSGGTYENGRWKRADDKAVFGEMSTNQLRHWEQWNDWIPGLYHSLYYVMNKNMKSGTENSGRELSIQNKKESEKSRYTTYFSIEAQEPENSGSSSEYRLEYFEQGEMKIDWDNVDESFETIRDWYYEIQEAYAIEAEKAYTGLPEEDLPGLVKLCKENPVKDKDIGRVTKFIQDYLKEHITYTRTPGMTPLSAEPVEYFLFEKEEGYCQHFASAAVLMYRMYGIPARYVTGYVAEPSDFEYGSDGRWHAEITDHDAHAWAEIFVRDFGWISVEVTPPEGAGGTGRDMGTQKDNVSGDEGDASSFWEFLGFQKDSPEDLKTDEEKNFVFGQRVYLSARAVRVSVCLIGILSILVIGGVVRNRGVRPEKMKRGGVRRRYRQLILMIHFAGLLKEYDGSEKEFPGKLAESFRGVSMEETVRLVDIVNEEAFGRNGAVDSEQTEFAEEICRRIMQAIYTELPVYKRILFCASGKR